MRFQVEKIELGLQEVGALVGLDALCFPHEERVQFDGSFWWVAIDSKADFGEFAGYAGLQIQKDGVGFLCRCGVRPVARAHGLQRKLIRARERGARGLGLTRLVSYTSKENTVSSNNLIACGYKLYTPDSWWGGASSLYWTKEL